MRDLLHSYFMFHSYFLFSIASYPVRVPRGGEPPLGVLCMLGMLCMGKDAALPACHAALAWRWVV